MPVQTLIQRLEQFIRTHKITSSLISLLFIAGIVTQSADIYSRIQALFRQNSYEIIDINLNHESRYSIGDPKEVSEGQGVGNPLFFHSLALKESKRIVTFLEESPNEIYLVRIHGEIHADDYWIQYPPQSFSVRLDYFVWQSKQPDGTYPSLSKIIHITQISAQHGWNSFSHSLLTSYSTTIELVGFFRFVFVRDKGDSSNQFNMIAVVPDAKKASLTLDELKKLDKKLYNRSKP